VFFSCFANLPQNIFLLAVKTLPATSPVLPENNWIQVAPKEERCCNQVTVRMAAIGANPIHILQECPLLSVVRFYLARRRGPKLGARKTR
jgi:hypothetical protein